MVAFFKQHRTLNYQKARLDSTHTASDGKRTCAKSPGVGNDLFMDDKATHVRSNYSPALKINKVLALKMGWMRSLGNYDLGQNLRQEFFIDTVPY